MNEGDVVVIDTGQIGTIVLSTVYGLVVLLRNRELWYGFPGQCHMPQSQEELDQAPVDVEPRAKKHLKRGT